MDETLLSPTRDSCGADRIAEYAFGFAGEGTSGGNVIIHAARDDR